MIGKKLSHYLITEKLGAGGMGEVYKAHDERLDRDVAIKVLREDLASDPERLRRFEQEARAASALNHPNIIHIYDIDKHGSMPYIAMEYVEGKTLREMLSDGPIPTEKLLQLSTQIAEGLAKAHTAGIIHRDLKPENLMVTSDGYVKILDFGLAKLLPQPGADSEAATITKEGTVAGAVMGTASYMSPEQALGKPLDARTDVFSLGAVLYEMTTGRRAFEGETTAGLFDEVLNKTPTPISLLNQDVPTTFDRLVKRALEKVPEKRYPSAKELLAELNATRGEPPVPETSEQKSIVVLPFENMSPDPDQEYFCDGMTEEIISDLSKVEAMRVISRSSAMSFKGSKRTAPEIAGQLKVEYVLEGSVRKAGNSLRITAQLIDAVKDAHIWAEKYSGTLDDVFEIQEQVSRAIVGELELRLTADEESKIAERPIDDFQAYDCYLRARDAIYKGFTPEGLDEAVRFLEAGLRIAGDNAELLATLANVYFNAVRIWHRDFEELSKAEDYANRAICVDPNTAQAHMVLGYAQWLRGNPRECFRLVTRALSLNPNDVDTVIWAFLIFISVGNTTKAAEAARHAIELDPLAPYWLGLVHAFEGRFDVAIEDTRNHTSQAVLETPGWRLWMGWMLIQANRIDEAMEVLGPLEPMTDWDLYVQTGRLLAFALKRDRNRVDEVAIPKYREAAKRDSYISCIVAGAYSILDDTDQALVFLEAAVDHGFINYPFLNQHDTLLAKLRNEPRYQKLMERVQDEQERFEEWA
jgi:serine/threonine protein kinase/tetratricopeptide (TPR) repeat protein